MLFADPSLAKRIEAAEARLITGMAEEARSRLSDEMTLIRPVSGGVAIFAGAGSPANKLAGLGFAPVDVAELEEVEREFDRRDTPLQIELSSLADNSVAEMLTGRGYRLVAYENVLGVQPCDANGTETAGRPPIEVRESGTNETGVWIDTLITAFCHPDTVEGLTPHESFERESLERFMGAIARTSGFRRYLAYLDGQVAGGASLSLNNDVALLCGAATLPAYRRRGVQTHLLRTRLKAACDERCAIAAMTTQPGSKSHENAARQGFSLLYVRAILRRCRRR